jgi:hypothetical protein
MTDGYSRSPRLLKGALIEFSSRFIGPIPNIIIFQYNPETLSRSLTPWASPQAPAASSTGGGDSAVASSSAASSSTSATAQPYDPGETFSLSLELDATDALETPESHPVAVLTGVADRIAAMEMLLYPDKEGNDLLGAIGDVLSLTSEDDPEPRYSVPILLFVWGAGRIVPVRVTSFSVEEQAFSTALYPIRAKVSIGLKVLSPHDLKDHPDTISKEIAITSYDFTFAQKNILSTANMANSVESILGMLPF